MTSTCNCIVVEILESVNADVLGAVTETDDSHRVTRFGSSNAEPSWKPESGGGTGVLVALDGAVGDGWFSVVIECRRGESDTGGPEDVVPSS